MLLISRPSTASSAVDTFSRVFLSFLLIYQYTGILYISTGIPRRTRYIWSPTQDLIKLNVFAGITYIKYGKTSEAAAALEEMHGRTLGDSSRHIKVMIASK